MKLLSSLDYLKVQICNCFGLDKLSWEDRIDWVNTNEDDLLNLCAKADEPAQMFSAVCAYHDALLELPINATVSLDATASCVQYIAILTGDRQSAVASNIVDSGIRADAYTMVHAATGLTDIPRSHCKKAIMTSAYGGTRDAEEIYGNNLDKFHQAMNEVLPEVLPFVNLMNSCWNPNVIAHKWVMPDGFEVVLPSEKKVERAVVFKGKPCVITETVEAPAKSSKRLCSCAVHSLDGLVVRELVARCGYTGKITNNPQMEEKLDALTVLTGFKSARILKYRDDSADFVLPETPFQILPIHDAFKIHPNYGNDLRKQYNQILFEIANSRILEWIIECLTGQDEVIIDKDTSWFHEILDADYSLC